VAVLADAQRVRFGTWPGGAGASEAGDAVLAAFLPDDLARGWRPWLRALPAETLDSSAELLARWRRSPWGAAVGESRWAQKQASAWADVGAAPETCLAPALWLGWRREIADLLDRHDLRPPGTVATLTTADAASAGPVDSVVYVCFGSEPRDVHRRCVGQATDRLLVLYQERSPLPGEEDASAGR
jgi:hypothetical protein